jgi:hypothetical protein
MLDFFEVVEGAVENSPEEKAAGRKSHEEGDDKFYQGDYFEHGLLLLRRLKSPLLPLFPKGELSKTSQSITPLFQRGARGDLIVIV